MSKRDHRKLLISKEKHKAELAEKVRVRQERVWNCDIDKYNENRLRGAIVQDLHNICNSSRYGPRLQAFIKVEKPAPYEFGVHNKKGEIVDMIHPFVSKFKHIFTNKNVCLDCASKKALSQIIDLFKRANMLDTDADKDYNECSYVFETSNAYKNKVVDAMFNIARFRLFWVRDIDLWKSDKEATNESNVMSLARHLFALYESPVFLEKYWLEDPSDENNKKYQEWYVNLGKGENLRTQNGLPIPITKKIAHYIVKAHPTYSVNHAFRWGQIHNMGGNPNHVVAINNMPLGDNFNNDEFWLTVIKFFIDNPFLDSFQYRNIYDYINAQKFINIIDRGEPPPQPNFSMKGREPNTLMVQVERWHQEMEARRPLRHNYYGLVREKYERWNPSGIQGHTKKEGNVTYHIVELLTSDELWEEGKEMHHCVGSYAYYCGKGESAIFSLYSEREKMDNSIVKERMATIEVKIKEKRIVQARKFCNAALDSDDLKIISQWKAKTGLSEM